MLFSVQKQLTASRSNPLGYQLAIDAPKESGLLPSLLGSSFKLQYKDSKDEAQNLAAGWTATLGGIPVSLPSADELWKGSWRRQPEFGGLMYTRYRIVEALAGLAIVTESTAEKRKALRGMFASGLKLQ